MHNHKVPDGWRRLKIGDIAQVGRGASPRPIQDPKWFADSGIGWIRIEDVTSSRKYIEKTKQYLSEEGVSKSVFVDRGDLIMSICGTIGRPMILNMQACIHDGFVVFKNFHKQINTEYFYYILQLLEKTFSGKGQPGTQKNLNRGLVSSTEILLPPFPEQIKIVQILASVDNNIDENEKIIGSVKTIKKGLMQQFFDSNEQFHKKEFVLLGSHAYVKARIGWRGLSSSEYTESGPYLIAGQHIKGTSIAWDKCDHISQFRYDESPEIQLKAGDVIISKDGTIGRLGFIETLSSQATINGTMMLIRSKDEKIFLPKYLYYIFQGPAFQKVVNEKVSGSSVPHIFQRDIVTLRIPLIDVKKQEKIIEILTNLDLRLNVELDRKVQLKKLKKSLMQNLLTGEKRVKVE